MQKKSPNEPLPADLQLHTFPSDLEISLMLTLQKLPSNTSEYTDIQAVISLQCRYLPLASTIMHLYIYIYQCLNPSGGGGSVDYGRGF